MNLAEIHLVWFEDQDQRRVIVETNLYYMQGRHTEAREPEVKGRGVIRSVGVGIWKFFVGVWIKRCLKAFMTWHEAACQWTGVPMTMLELQIVKLSSEDDMLNCQADHGKVPYLKDENGDPLTDPIVKAIQKLLCGAWVELIRCKLTPKTWGKATPTARQIVHTLMENTRSLFKFTDNSWKLDYLMNMSYSAWQRNHIDDDGD
ncbi:hypothetical protein BDR05DRAFT_950679 [Suillus weaverae]|nr:hypothetical protein BDR05DRAFT_950679 [Suillus weaverae]